MCNWPKAMNKKENMNTKTKKNSPSHHVGKIKKMLTEVALHARDDVSKVSEPKAQALFETTAEVLGGLAKAYKDYEAKSEPAWR